MNVEELVTNLGLPEVLREIAAHAERMGRGCRSDAAASRMEGVAGLLQTAADRVEQAVEEEGGRP